MQQGTSQQRIGLQLCAGLLIFAAIVGLPALASACTPNQQTCSSGYGVNEVFFGTGGELNACSTGSTGYCSKQSAGELSVGNTASTTYQAQGGFNTDREPSLTLIVNSASFNFGQVSAGTTYTATATFSVKTYLASSYQVVTSAPAPTSGAYTMASPSTPTASNPSAEQFGINLVANNSCGGGMPASLGANPVQVPSSSFSYGAVASGYSTACQFKYVNNDVIASSTKSSGETDFTISYIVNTVSSMPSGIYSMNQSLVATSTF